MPLLHKEPFYTYFSPDQSSATVVFEMATDSDKLFRKILEHKERTRYWVIRNLVGTEEFPQFGLYYGIIDLDEAVWEMYAKDPYGSIKDGTYFKGCILNLGNVKSLIETITNENAER